MGYRQMTTQGSRVTFETFNDGVCAFCPPDEEGNAGKPKEKIRYGERTVGSQRYYEAMTNKVKIDHMIRVPYQPWLTTEYLAVISGEVYEIVQVQLIPDTLPRTQNVTLHRSRQRRITYGTV